MGRLILSLLSFAASAQIPPPPVAPEYTISTDVELVLLDVSVKTEDGGFVSGLNKSNFIVYEDGKAQPITFFEAQDAPVTVGLVVDSSGSMRSRRAEVITAALAFVQSSNPDDEVFVVNFNDRPSLGLPGGMPFSNDTTMLREAFFKSVAEGRTALYDAIAMAADHLEHGTHEKKTLLVISDGGDNMSHLDLHNVLDLAQRKFVTVYTIGIFDEEAKDKNPGVLKKLARETGGESFIPRHLSGIIATCRQVSHDIRSRYTIGYVPPREGDNGFRKVKVTASAPGRGKLEIRTRTGYVPQSRPTSKAQEVPK